jgi:hypothetical protein
MLDSVGFIRNQIKARFVCLHCGFGMSYFLNPEVGTLELGRYDNLVNFGIVWI